MTQTPPVAWLVDVPANDPYGKTCFISACRGNSDIAEALSYFLFAASKEVEQKKANASDQCITIKRNLETIARHLEVSPKTAISYIRKLTEWKFIIAHGYHHTYDVYHHEVEQAMQTPPTPEWPKPRGKHIKQSEDCRDGKSTIHAEDCRDGKDCRDERINELEAWIVDLQTQMVNLQSEMVNLQTRMADLQSLQSSESTLQEAREAQIDPLVITNNYSNITEENIYVNADALTRTHSQETAENETHYQHFDATSPQDIHTEQASTAIPIATTKPQTELIGVATRNTDSLPEVTPPAPDKSNSNGHTPRKFAPPVMPPDDVAWNAETLVQVLEARQGRRFPNGAQKKVNRVRDQALRDAEAIIDMGDIDRVAFVLAVNHLENRKNKWWLDNVGHVQPRHLLKNDKIHEMIDELKRQYGPSWREKLTQKNTATRKPSGPLATLPPPPKSNAELRMEAV